GLERVLSQSPPRLASGTELRRHQIDALAGMLTELIAATQVEPELNGNGNGEAAVAEVEPEEDEEDLGVHLEEPADELELPEEHHGKDPGSSRRARSASSCSRTAGYSSPSSTASSPRRGTATASRTRSSRGRSRNTRIRSP